MAFFKLAIKVEKLALCRLEKLSKVIKMQFSDK